MTTKTTEPALITQALLDRLDQIFPILADSVAECERSEQTVAALETWIRQTLEHIEENVSANLSALMHQRDATIERLESTLMYFARGENGVTEDGKNAHEIARKYVSLERLTANMRIVGSLQALLRLHVRAVDDSSVSVSTMVEQLCAERKKMIGERAILVSALEDITTADETSTVAGAVAIAQKALGLLS